jgi:hypothetical protein
MDMILHVVFSNLIMYNKHCDSWMPTRILSNMETWLIQRGLWPKWSKFIFYVEKEYLLQLQKSRVLDNATESFRDIILDMQICLSKCCALWPKYFVHCLRQMISGYAMMSSKSRLCCYDRLYSDSGMVSFPNVTYAGPHDGVASTVKLLAAYTCLWSV